MCLFCLAFVWSVHGAHTKNKHKLNYTIGCHMLLHILGTYFCQIRSRRIFGPQFLQRPWAARGSQMSWSNRECRWQVVLGHHIPRANRGSSERRRYQWSRWMRLGHNGASDRMSTPCLFRSERMILNHCFLGFLLSGNPRKASLSPPSQMLIQTKSASQGL